MATRRQRAKQRQPQPPEPAADYEHIGVVLRLRPLLRWHRRAGPREAVAEVGAVVQRELGHVHRLREAELALSFRRAASLWRALLCADADVYLRRAPVLC